jgi:hypothetical protein
VQKVRRSRPFSRDRRAAEPHAQVQDFLSVVEVHPLDVVLVVIREVPRTENTAIFAAAFSPDGRFIAYAVGEAGSGRVSVIPSPTFAVGPVLKQNLGGLLR